MGEMGQQHVGQGLAVAAHHLCVAVHKLLQLVFQPIAPAAGKFLEEGRGPVGTIHLVAVVEKGMREGGVALQEGLFDVLQVVRHGGRVEMIDHIALSTGGCPLHLLARAALIEGDDPLLSVSLGVCLPDY